MKKEWKERWIKALRSKKYRQSREALRRKHGGFCCLGVLCDIVDPEGWEDNCSYSGLIEFRYKRSVEDSYPPNNVLTMVGLSKTVIGDLAQMNDDERLSFKQIADWIEKNL